MNDQPVPRKKDGGALMFWTYHNQLQLQLERIDAAILELARTGHETKRRLTAIEQAIRCHSRIIYEDKETVQMFCIACHHEFYLPIAEVDNPDFVTACPRCHNWSLPLPEKTQEDYSPKMIAEKTGFSYVTIRKTIQELGLRNGKRFQLYGEEDFQKIVDVLKTKKPRRKERK